MTAKELRRRYDDIAKPPYDPMYARMSQIADDALTALEERERELEMLRQLSESIEDVRNGRVVSLDEIDTEETNT